MKKLFILLCCLFLFACSAQTPYGNIDFKIDAETWLEIIKIATSRDIENSVETPGGKIYVCDSDCLGSWGEKGTFLTRKEIEKINKILKKTNTFTFENTIGDLIKITK